MASAAICEPDGHAPGGPGLGWSEPQLGAATFGVARAEAAHREPMRVAPATPPGTAYLSTSPFAADSLARLGMLGSPNQSGFVARNVDYHKISRHAGN